MQVLGALTLLQLHSCCHDGLTQQFCGPRAAQTAPIITAPALSGLPDSRPTLTSPSLTRCARLQPLWRSQAPQSDAPLESPGRALPGRPEVTGVTGPQVPTCPS